MGLVSESLNLISRTSTKLEAQFRHRWVTDVMNQYIIVIDRCLALSRSFRLFHYIWGVFFFLKKKSSFILYGGEPYGGVTYGLLYLQYIAVGSFNTIPLNDDSCVISLLLNKSCKYIFTSAPLGLWQSRKFCEVLSSNNSSETTSRVCFRL